MPLTVRSPLNNEIVVGEVEFYLLLRESGETSLNRDARQLNANFIGTDYNYANSNDFRKMFLENSIETDDIKAQVRGAEGIDDPSNLSHVNSTLRNNPEFNEYAT